jgi:beta-glucosidase
VVKSQPRELRFPDGFLWGVATAAHQNEGMNVHNDVWAWEQAGNHTADGTVSGRAADWWNRAEEDFDRAADLGLNSLRLSIEWSRIEPEPGRWDAAALERYREMLQALVRRGIRPMLTLHHFTNPRWLADRGGWLRPDVVPAFARFAAHVAAGLGDLRFVVHAQRAGDLRRLLPTSWAAGRAKGLAFLRVTRHQLRAHAAAYHAVRAARPHARVGLVQHFAGFEPSDPASPLDRLAAAVRDTTLNWRLVEGVVTGRLKPPYGLGLRRHPGASSSSDYIGVNYYGRHPLRFDRSSPGTLFASPGRVRPERAWPAPWQDREIHPQGLESFLLRLTHYGKPLYVTENGLDDAGTGRPRLHPDPPRRHPPGHPQRGRRPGLLPLDPGRQLRMGRGLVHTLRLFALDPQTQVRTIRPSARLFQEIVKANAISADLVERWAPEVALEVFGAK